MCNDISSWKVACSFCLVIFRHVLLILNTHSHTDRTATFSSATCAPEQAHSTTVAVYVPAVGESRADMEEPTAYCFLLDLFKWGPRPLTPCCKLLGSTKMLVSNQIAWG